MGVYEELDDAKAELEQLKADYKIKLDLSESLRKAHNEQLIKIQEAGSKSEKLSRELSDMAEELSAAKLMSEDLKLKLKEKEALIKHLTSANDKLRTEAGLKSEKLSRDLSDMAEELSGAKLISEDLKVKLNEKEARIKHMTSANDKLRAETGSKSEKLSRELSDMAEELSAAKLMSEELKLKLKEKEALIKHLTSANDKLRTDWKEKLQRSEDEKKGLALALDEANAKNLDQDKQIGALREENVGLKGFVSVSQNRCLEADKNAKVFKDARQRDDTLLSLEEEKNKYESQLKWKKEKFSHLVEAHENLKSEFRVKEKEWEKEKTSLINEISSFQTNLDSQIRISESLKSHLDMCNHALAHEESRRKRLEIELSESRAHFDNVFTEFEETKSKIESLTGGERDKEIASLRNTLGTKETLYKEMEYQVRMLEQEKQDLMLSLKELQETQIQGAGNSSSLTKIRNKLRRLEQVHKDCPTRLKDKETEWSSQLQIWIQKLDCCSSELESKKMLIEKLEMEAEVRDSAMLELALHKEEATLLSLILKSEFLEGERKLHDAYTDVYQKKDESRERRSLISAELDMKSSALLQAQGDVEEERKKVVDLSEKVESFNVIEEKQLSLVKEIERQREMLHESDACTYGLKKQLLSMESELNEVRHALDEANKKLDEKFCEGNELELLIWKCIAQELKYNLEEDHQTQRNLQASLHVQLLNMKSNLKKLSDAMDTANDELATKFCEVNAVEFELQIWKSVAEQLNRNLENNCYMRKEMEASLLAQVAVEVNLKREKDNLLDLLEDKEKRIDGLQQQLISLNGKLETAEIGNVTPASIKNAKNYDQEEEELMKKELEGAILAQISAERKFEHEKESLKQILEERDQRIEDLQQLVKSLEQEFQTSTGSFSSRLSGMQAEINLFHKAWNKVATAMVLNEMEIQEKNLIAAEMQDDLSKLEVELQAKKSEVKSLTNNLEKLNAEKGKIFDDVVNLSSERENLFEAIEGLSDRLEQELNRSDVLVEKYNAEKGKIHENLFESIQGMYNKFGELSREDEQLMERLASIVQTFDSTEFKTGDKFLEKENSRNSFSSLITTKGAISDDRLPLRALNHL